MGIFVSWRLVRRGNRLAWSSHWRKVEFLTPDPKTSLNLDYDWAKLVLHGSLTADRGPDRWRRIRMRLWAPFPPHVFEHY
jgi:hypothetical protein